VPSVVVQVKDLVRRAVRRWTPWPQRSTSSSSPVCTPPRRAATRATGQATSVRAACPPTS